jgi:hypothetical protein
MIEDIKIAIIRIGTVGFCMGELLKRLVEFPGNYILIKMNRCIKCGRKLDKCGLCFGCSPEYIRAAKKWKESLNRLYGAGRK